MNSNGILYLTVSDKGIVRIWDTSALALAGRKENEVGVQLSLTAPQMRTILRAEQAAKERK